MRIYRLKQYSGVAVMIKLRCFVNAPMIILLMIVFGPSLIFAADLVLVASKNVPDSSLTREEVKSIFVGQKTEWSDRSKITFVVFKKSEEMKSFMKVYVGKTPFQFNNYWKHQVFTGNGFFPRVFESEKELLDFVATNKGVVSYVSEDAPIDNVKVLTVR